MYIDSASWETSGFTDADFALEMRQLRRPATAYLMDLSEFL